MKVISSQSQFAIQNSCENEYGIDCDPIIIHCECLGIFIKNYKQKKEKEKKEREYIYMLTCPDSLNGLDLGLCRQLIYMVGNGFPTMDNSEMSFQVALLYPWKTLFPLALSYSPSFGILSLSLSLSLSLLRMTNLFSLFSSLIYSLRLVGYL